MVRYRRSWPSTKRRPGPALTDEVGYIPSAREMAATMSPDQVKNKAKEIGRAMTKAVADHGPRSGRRRHLPSPTTR